MKNIRKAGGVTTLLAVMLTVCMLFSACGSGQSDYSSGSPDSGSQTEQESASSADTDTAGGSDTSQASAASSFSISDIPAYSGDPYVVISDNVPDFSESDLTTQSYEQYSELDSLGRCGVCIASVGRDLMPDEERGSIGMIKPTGWHTVKYDWVDGKYLYNRCHLIGYQLTGENANERNLITGTRYLNVDGMLPFENMVADYVKESGNHVLYRVTPVFTGNNLVADGVHMEAESVEDSGAGIEFNVFCYNVQPGVTIDYATGDSYASGTSDSESGTTNSASGAASSSSSQDAAVSEYVLNTNTKKFHRPDCSAVSSMNPENKVTVSESRDQIIAEGYEPCGLCNP
ncbi:MAG: DNA/RNA non-specific endonuclease [Anaerovoracaceae bacterium]|jgi:DNA-entry nuclease